MPDLTPDYAQNQANWRDITINQFSVTNNILLTISTAYFASIFDKAFLKTLSVTFCRLYDFRISRHIALTRQRVFSQHNSKLPHRHVGEITAANRICTFVGILFCRLDFISEQDVATYVTNKTGISERFNKLRRQAEILGTASWRWTKVQVLLLIVSLILYVISLIK